MIYICFTFICVIWRLWMTELLASQKYEVDQGTGYKSFGDFLRKIVRARPVRTEAEAAETILYIVALPCLGSTLPGICFAAVPFNRSCLMTNLGAQRSKISRACNPTHSRQVAADCVFGCAGWSGGQPRDRYGHRLGQDVSDIRAGIHQRNHVQLARLHGRYGRVWRLPQRVADRF